MARTGRGLDKRESSLMFREITPPHGWKQDSKFHYLRLTLPGFEAKDITIHMDKYGHLVVRGNKQVSEHKHMSFDETYDVPNDANLEDASGMFEDGQIYCVAIPKLLHHHAITMPQLQNHNPNPNPNSKKDINDSLHKTNVPPRSSNDYLKQIRGDKYPKKEIALFLAILVALILLIAVVLILKFRHR
ncbi:hypothetical protein C2S51_018653 [Perilla frutescens var. frutescens]|nr:hypothetical protein C2S51_018653 [Perilla frutescens var. frutescens]